MSAELADLSPARFNTPILQQFYPHTSHGLSSSQQPCPSWSYPLPGLGNLRLRQPSKHGHVLMYVLHFSGSLTFIGRVCYFRAFTDNVYETIYPCSGSQSRHGTV